MGITLATGGSSVEISRFSFCIICGRNSCRSQGSCHSSCGQRCAHFDCSSQDSLAKANLNYTGQALIISGASISAYFVTVDKSILASARKHNRAQFEKRV